MEAKHPCKIPATVQKWISILRTCSQQKNLHHAKHVYAFMQLHHLELHPILANHLIPTLVECGSLPDARRAFDNLAPHRQNQHSWNVLISAYIEQDQPQHAFSLYNQMLWARDCVRPNRVTFLSLLHACGRLKDMERGLALHVDIIQRGLESDIFMDSAVVGNTLVDMYCRCGSIFEACRVFESMPVRDVVSWNAMISGYAQYGLNAEASLCLQQMQVEGTSPVSVSFVCSLKACCRKEAVETGQYIHSETTKRGMERELYVGNMLVDMYGKCGLLREACRVLDGVPVRDAVSWGALIAGYMEHGLGDEAVKCFQRMMQEGISPDGAAFVCTLKGCAIAQALVAGQSLHAETTKMGFERELHVGSTLVDTYSQCGLLPEAHQIFSRLPVRNTTLWNGIIAGYVEYGWGEEAWKCFQDMLLEGISPDTATLICSLKACGISQFLNRGQEIHIEATKRGLERELFMGSLLVDMYIKCSSLAEAHQAFDRLLVRDVVSWATLFAGYTQHGVGEEVENCFQRMVLEGIAPDSIAFVYVLKACGALGALETGREIHSETTKRGFDKGLCIGNMLVVMYGQCGYLTESYQVLDRLPDRDAVSWAALVAAYLEHGHCEYAMSCFQQMHKEGISADSVTFACCLQACRTSQGFETGANLHAETTKRGFEREPHLASTLVDMYMNCSKLAEAQQVFHALSVRDAVSYSAVIAGYVEHGFNEEARICFKQMLIDGISPDCVSFITIMKAFGTIGALETGREVHAETIKRGLERELDVGSTLVDMYSACGSTADAHQVFDMLPVKNVVSWAALVARYAEHGLVEEAGDVFQQMLGEDLSPDCVTFLCSLKACSFCGTVETGRELHAEVAKRGWDIKLYVGSALVDMYGECGSLAEARQAFDMLPVRSVVSWNTMIKAFGKNHKGNMAVKCFEDMQEQGVKPNSTTFASLLAACSHSSFVLKGREYFRLMIYFGIEPTLEHYACMIDLLARSGHVYEAERLVATMQGPRSSVLLLDLLSACNIYGKTDLGQRCFQQLVEANQEDSSAYMLMGGIYASAGRWSHVSRLEETRTSAGVKKKPGSAVIEVNKKQHQFVVGLDQQNVESLEISCLRTKDEGYVPNLELLLRNIFDEDLEFSNM